MITQNFDLGNVNKKLFLGNVNTKLLLAIEKAHYIPQLFCQ